MNVLLVEDDPGIGRFVARGLAAHGYRVAWERSGERVVELVATDAFVAAILDLGLPDIDGIDLCRVLRRVRPRLSILMLTARGALQDRLDGFDAGADDYLPKPFAFDELLARLAAIIRRVEPAEDGTLRFGALALDRLARAARVGDMPVALSRREFDLLAALVSGGGAVVARDALTRALWGDNAGITDNALDVYVGYVRRRLAEMAGAPTVQTIRGRGFRLAEPSSQGASRT